MAKVKHDAVEHSKLIGTAIERMSNNHMKWILALFTVMGFAITMDRFLWSLNPVAKLVSYAITGVILSLLIITTILISKRYFILELKFRQKQRKVLEGTIDTWDMNPLNEKVDKKKSWIFIMSWWIVGLFMISQLAFITVGALQVMGAM